MSSRLSSSRGGIVRVARQLREGNMNVMNRQVSFELDVSRGRKDQ